MSPQMMLFAAIKVLVTSESPQINDLPLMTNARVSPHIKASPQIRESPQIIELPIKSPQMIDKLRTRFTLPVRGSYCTAGDNAAYRMGSLF